MDPGVDNIINEILERDPMLSDPVVGVYGPESSEVEDAMGNISGGNKENTPPPTLYPTDFFHYSPPPFVEPYPPELKPVGDAHSDSFDYYSSFQQVERPDSSSLLASLQQTPNPSTTSEISPPPPAQQQTMAPVKTAPPAKRQRKTVMTKQRENSTSTDSPPASALAEGNGDDGELDELVKRAGEACAKYPEATR
jgi:hypothetical protein